MYPSIDPIDYVTRERLTKETAETGPSVCADAKLPVFCVHSSVFCVHSQSSVYTPSHSWAQQKLSPLSQLNILLTINSPLLS